MTRCLARLVYLVFWLLLGCEESPHSRSPEFTLLHHDLIRFEPRSCDYSQHAYVRFRCYTAVHLDGFKHRYPITILEPRNTHGALPTVVSIPGGPGQGAQTQAPWVLNWADWMAQFELEHRMVLYEPFGTFGSNAFWRCKAYERLSIELAAKDIDIEDEIRQLDSVTHTCLAEYDTKLRRVFGLHSGLSDVNSRFMKDTLTMLLKALPDDKVHLLGTSYGTRVALLMAENTKVASLVLDSPYPFSKGTLLDWPALLGDAFNKHERAFKRLTSHKQAYSEVFRFAFDYLNTNPQMWRLERWDGSGDIDFVLTPDRLLTLHFHVLYNESLLTHYYEGLAKIIEKPAELRWVLEDLVTNIFDAEFSSLIYMAVECNDNQGVSQEDFFSAVLQSEDQFTNWSALFDDDVCSSDFFDNTDPLQNHIYVEKPTLILSGELDPITPSSWAEELAVFLPRAELYVRRDKGHGVLSSEVCLMPRLKQFWSQDWQGGAMDDRYRQYLAKCEDQP